MPARKAPPPQYNYLETDVALPFSVPKSKMTENQVSSGNTKLILTLEQSLKQNQGQMEHKESAIDN